MRGPSIGKLNNVEAVQVELRKVYRAGRRGDIETQDMTRFASVLQTLVGVMRDSDLEARIKTLEARQ